MSLSAKYRMSESTLLKFVELYRSEECLWNNYHPDYKTHQCRTKAAERIAGRLSLPQFGPGEVLHKIKNLRSSYCTELKRINLSLRRGDADVYRPRVFWFKIVDDFLKPFCQVQIRGKDGSVSEEFIEINNSQIVPFVDTGRVDPQPAKRSRMDNPEYVSIRPDPSSDDHDVFGRFVASQLRELSSEYALQAQCGILQVLAEERVKYYQEVVNADRVD